MLLRFTGGLIVPETAGSTPVIVERILRALHSEGGRNISASNTRVEFDGLTGTRSTSPLTNIEHGKLTIDDRSIPRRIIFYIEIERWSFLVSGGLFISTIVAIFIGFNKFNPLAIFGLALFPFFCMYSFIIRYRFRRWLDAKLKSNSEIDKHQSDA
jgi:hypothetical protein